jgi:hypothetical protein
MEKTIAFKPKYFATRINLMGLIVIITTVLVLRSSFIDRGTYVAIASPLIFMFLLFLFYSNRHEVQNILLSKNKVGLSFFNQNSIFFKSPSIELDRTHIKAEVMDKKITLISNNKIVGILRTRNLENDDSCTEIENYFLENIS